MSVVALYRVAHAVSLVHVLLNVVEAIAPREVFVIDRIKYLKHSLVETFLQIIFVIAICSGELPSHYYEQFI